MLTLKQCIDRNVETKVAVEPYVVNVVSYGTVEEQVPVNVRVENKIYPLTRSDLRFTYKKVENIKKITIGNYSLSIYNPRGSEIQLGCHRLIVDHYDSIIHTGNQWQAIMYVDIVDDDEVTEIINSAPVEEAVKNAFNNIIFNNNSIKSLLNEYEYDPFIDFSKYPRMAEKSFRKLYDIENGLNNMYKSRISLYLTSSNEIQNVCIEFNKFYVHDNSIILNYEYKRMYSNTIAFITWLLTKSTEDLYYPAILSRRSNSIITQVRYSPLGEKSGSNYSTVLLSLDPTFDFDILFIIKYIVYNDLSVTCDYSYLIIDKYNSEEEVSLKLYKKKDVVTDLYDLALLIEELTFNGEIDDIEDYKEFVNEFKENDSTVESDDYEGYEIIRRGSSEGYHIVARENEVDYTIIHFGNEDGKDY